jgi:hypothetical protein
LARSPETVRHNVRQRATRRGHHLVPFRQLNTLPLWSAHCSNEGCRATVALGGRGPITYEGTALETDCPLETY